ncbi:TPA: hypothetical protein ACHWTG_005517, partial [Escherichia coli]
VRDWLSHERIEQLEESGIDIKKLANPVLLAYLRSLENENFNNLCERSSKIVEHYFQAMLERERERQDLLMTPEKQSSILTMVALDM